MKKRKATTINDVARHCGVSKATVSAVLNERDTVSDATRAKVQRVMELLNYRPSGAARRTSRAAGKRCLGYLIKEATNPYYAETLAGIQQVAQQHGYQVFVASSEGAFGREKELVEQFASRDLDGMILTPILNDETDLSHLFELKRRNVPFVLLERVRGLQANLVDVDNVAASCEAVKYLIRQGHTRIAHFAGPDYSAHSKERIEGVRRAFSESLIAFDDRVVVRAGDSLEEGYCASRDFFLSTAEMPTAVTCYNDLVALGVLKALKELGISVPDQVSVVGFDDLEVLGYFPLPLTTVHVPKRDMGRLATEILIRQIESGDMSTPERISLESRLVVRESTRAVSSDATNSVRLEA